MPQDLILLCRNLAEYWLGAIWLNESHGISYHVLSCHMTSPCDYRQEVSICSGNGMVPSNIWPLSYFGLTKVHEAMEVHQRQMTECLNSISNRPKLRSLYYEAGVFW